MYIVVREIARPSAEALDAVRPYAVAVLSDALGRTGTMDAGIKPLAEGMRIVGTAVTVRAYPADNLMIHLGLKLARPGDVLVIDADGVTDTAVVGELVGACAQRQGLAGFIVDGAVRDRAGFRELGFPVFARANVPNGPLKNGPGSVNVPIACGGQIVNPGDIVVGDEDGVVVIPPTRWEAVAQAARAILEKEAGNRRRIEAGEIMWDFLGLDKAIATMPIEWR